MQAHRLDRIGTSSKQSEPKQDISLERTYTIRLKEFSHFLCINVEHVHRYLYIHLHTDTAAEGVVPGAHVDLYKEREREREN